MNLPIPLEYAPMEAKLVTKLPAGDDWQFEPKWDGFRCLAFRDGDEVELRSKSDKPLTRYFPEIEAALKKVAARKFVVDGEIVVPVDGNPSFDHLLQRIHPAASRVRKLAFETPACLIVFDLLVDAEGNDLTTTILRKRRPALVDFFRRYLEPVKGFDLSPCTDDREVAEEWLSGQEGTDGVMAKKLDLPYCTGERTGMQKVKRMKTADCVVGGIRYASKGTGVGSLLLGLYGDDGLLHHCGFSSSFTASERAEVTEKVKPYLGGSGFSGAAPGGPSRWATERTSEWIPLEPSLVVEVQYDHWSGGRFRHGTKLLRWRPDKAPRSCTYDQLGRGKKELGFPRR